MLHAGAGTWIIASQTMDDCLKVSMVDGTRTSLAPTQGHRLVSSVARMPGVAVPGRSAGLETGEACQRTSRHCSCKWVALGMAVVLLPHSDCTFPKRGIRQRGPWWWRPPVQAYPMRGWGGGSSALHALLWGTWVGIPNELKCHPTPFRCQVCSSLAIVCSHSITVPNGRQVSRRALQTDGTVSPAALYTVALLNTVTLPATHTSRTRTAPVPRGPPSVGVHLRRAGGQCGLIQRRVRSFIKFQLHALEPLRGLRSRGWAWARHKACRTLTPGMAFPPARDQGYDHRHDWWRAQAGITALLWTHAPAPQSTTTLCMPPPCPGPMPHTAKPTACPRGGRERTTRHRKQSRAPNKGGEAAPEQERAPKTASGCHRGKARTASVRSGGILHPSGWQCPPQPPLTTLNGPST